jgi:hypothetical protein
MNLERKIFDGKNFIFPKIFIANKTYEFSSTKWFYIDQ